ncbi:MAG: flagellar motor protein MotB [Hyphomicrobiales bacterium]
MAKKQKCGGGGAPEWLVTFADLMSLLVCFFVLIISFSIQDKEKLQIVAGSMREAFGVRSDSRKAGMIEIDGAPVREYVKSVAMKPEPNDTEFSDRRHNEMTKQGPEADTHEIEESKVAKPRDFAAAATSLRQAWQELPEITSLSEHIMVEETEEGLNIQLVDQDGRSMFPEGSKYPYETVRMLLAKMAPVLRQLPNRVQITGHTAAGQSFINPRYGAWELSADRANATRQILEEYGVPADRFYGVVGKADTDPLFANDPFLASNRRVSILIMQEAPPLPPGFQP